MAKWNINITDFLGGLAPGWYREIYPSYGNKNMAGDMTACDLSCPGYIKNGPWSVPLTNGTDAGAVTTRIASIYPQSVTSGVTYGIGGNKLYKISNITVTSDATWPHTIDKAAVSSETGSDVVVYKGNLYYSYNHSGSAGDIGKYDLASTFDDDWGSTVPSGAAVLQGDVFHQMIVGTNDVMYITNGRYVASYDGTTLIPQALDLPTGSVISSIQWLGERLYIFSNNPSIAGQNRSTSDIYIWDGTTSSWEASVRLPYTVGGSYVWNSQLYFFYYDVSDFQYTLAMVDGISVIDITEFPTTGGILPTHSMITTYNNFMLWKCGTSIYAYGVGNHNLPLRVFKYSYTTSYVPGALSNPFGFILDAYQSGVSTYECVYKSGNYSGSTWDSLMFDVSGENGMSKIDTVVINFKKLESGAVLNWSLVNSKGTTIYSDVISYAKFGAVTQSVYKLNGLITQDFKIRFSWASYYPTCIKSVKIFGNTQ